FVDETLDDVHDECRLVEIARRVEYANRLAPLLARPEVLAETRRVVPDKRVGRIEDMPVRTVILLELDELHRRVGAREIAREMLHVRDVRAAKRIDRLVVVAH